MHLRGLVRSGTLEENPPESGTIELILRVQGVGPDQPRTIVVPFDLLVREPDIDPDAVERRGFEAEVRQADDGRWIVARIAFARRVLRPPGS